MSRLAARLRHLLTPAGMADQVALAIILVGLFLLVTACDDTEPYYRTCADAPGELSIGDPGYRLALDADRDGKACT